MEVLGCFCKNRLFSIINPYKFSLRTLKQRKQVKHLLGLPPQDAKSLDQKLEEHNYKDPSVYYKVNISLPPKTGINHQANREERRTYFKKIKGDLELEKKARKNELNVDLDEVYKEWIEESSSEHIKVAAEHYGVFEDLFGDAFFYPRINLEVNFSFEQSLFPVCRGNILKPSQALSEPAISYESDPNTLWTLVATNPDGHLQDQNAEYLHWFLGNIPGRDLSKAEVVAEYMQPFPARGTGFQRFIFILYQQTGKVDYTPIKIASEINLKERTFSTYEFYRDRQEQLTPAGLAFCQVDWDLSVSNFFHTTLNMDEPVFEYDFAPPYHPKQKMYPIRQPFNLYMDRYRDPKQIAKEYLLRKLKNRNPFEKPKPKVKYPNAGPVDHDLDERLFGHIPSWLKREKLKSRLGYGRINDY